MEDARTLTISWFICLCTKYGGERVWNRLPDPFVPRVCTCGSDKDARDDTLCYSQIRKVKEKNVLKVLRSIRVGDAKCTADMAMQLTTNLIVRLAAAVVEPT